MRLSILGIDIAKSKFDVVLLHQRNLFLTSKYAAFYAHQLTILVFSF